MTPIEARGAAAAGRAAARWRARVRDAVGAMRGVTAEMRDDGVVVRGRRLRARWLRDPRLRWLGGWL